MITCDYQTILPVARTVYGDDPEAFPAAQKPIERAPREGQFRLQGAPPGTTLPAALGELHDALAEVTA